MSTEWNCYKYFSAIKWWRNSANYGFGHFNEDLYKKYLLARYESFNSHENYHNQTINFKKTLLHS